MTNNKAIELLDNLLGVVEDNHGSDYDKAIHMAIDALAADVREMAKYYDCSCYIPYPNENHRFKNGKSKCDRYRPVKFTRKSIYGCVTRCKRVTERG